MQYTCTTCPSCYGSWACQSTLQRPSCSTAQFQPSSSWCQDALRWERTWHHPWLTGPCKQQVPLSMTTQAVHVRMLLAEGGMQREEVLSA